MRKASHTNRRDTRKLKKIAKYDKKHLRSIQHLIGMKMANNIQGPSKSTAIQMCGRVCFVYPMARSTRSNALGKYAVCESTQITAAFSSV